MSPRVTPDFELLHAWRDGNRDAGDELLSRHFDSVCRFFRSKLGSNLTEVEDLIQRTFLDCSESIDRIRSDSFKSYLFAIARNRLYDHLRAQHQRPVVELVNASIADLGTSPSQQVARAEEGELVVKALQQLPLDFQITLELRYWEHLGDEEIATALSVSANTIRSRLSRGRSMLRETVQKLASSTRVAETTMTEFLRDSAT